MSRSKYKKGRQIESISDFDQCESLWYKWNGRTAHRSALMSLQYRTLMQTIINGRIFVAERVDDEPNTKQIADLRSYASARKGELAKMINDAADTIEALSAKQEGIVDAIKTADINGWVKDDLLGRIKALSEGGTKA